MDRGRGDPPAKDGHEGVVGLGVFLGGDAFIAEGEVVEGEGGEGGDEAAEGEEEAGGARKEDVGCVGLWKEMSAGRRRR